MNCRRLIRTPLLQVRTASHQIVEWNSLLSRAKAHALERSGTMPVSRPTRPVDFSAVKSALENRTDDTGFASRYIWERRFPSCGGMFRLTLLVRPPKKAERRGSSPRENLMRKVLRGYAKDKTGNLILIGTMPAPHSKDKSSPRERRDKRHLVRQRATIFKKETVG